MRPIVNNPIKNSKDCPQSPNQRRAIIPMRSWRPRNDYTQISQIRCYIIEVQIFALLNPLHTRPSSECGKYNGSRNIVSVSNHTWIIYSSRPMILDYFASNRLLGLDWRHQRALSSAISWLKKKTNHALLFYPKFVIACSQFPLSMINLRVRQTKLYIIDDTSIKCHLQKRHTHLLLKICRLRSWRFLLMFP